MRPPESPPPPARFSTALRVAVEASGMSLSALRQALLDVGLDVAVPTLSKWQNGRARPRGARSQQAVLLLELVLGLGSGSLVGLLPAPSRTGPRPRPRTPSLPPFPSLSGDGEGSRPNHERLAWRVWHETVTLDEQGLLVDIAEDSTVTALADGVDRLVFSYWPRSADRRRAGPPRTTPRPGPEPRPRPTGPGGAAKWPC